METAKRLSKSEILEYINISDDLFNELVEYDKNLLIILNDMVEKVNSFFIQQYNEKQTKEKTKLWFNAENQQLANFTPKQMILLGKHNRVMQFINYALEQNIRQ